MYDLDEEFAIKRLKLQLSTKAISQREYNAEYEALLNVRRAFEVSHTEAYKDEMKKRQKELAQMLREDTDKDSPLESL